MRYLYFKLRRFFWTAFSKVFSNIVLTFPMSELVVAIFDFGLRRLNVALSDEATFCMRTVGKWQNRAKKCVLAHHENEKILNEKKEEKE